MRDLFVSALSNAASSVAVVTTAGNTGMAGSTISSFCSVSADRKAGLGCMMSAFGEGVARVGGLPGWVFLHDAREAV